MMKTIKSPKKEREENSLRSLGGEDADVDGDDKGKENVAAVSPHQLINHFAVFICQKSPMDFKQICRLCVRHQFRHHFFPHPCRLSVPPLSHPEMIINHCKIGNFRKILAPVKISIPLLIRSVTCAKNGIFPGKKNVERRGVSVACRGG